MLLRNMPALLPYTYTGVVSARVLGDVPLGLARPNWASDHAGVAVEITRMPLFE